MSKERNCCAWAPTEKWSLYLVNEALNVSPPYFSVFHRRLGCKEEACPRRIIMWSVHSFSVLSQRKLPWIHYKHSDPHHHCWLCSSKSPVLERASSAPYPPPAPSFRREDKEWPWECQPPQRLLQIRPFSLFHNSRERKDKAFYNPLLYFRPF